MKKILILLVIISMFITSSAFADQKYNIVVKHIFNDTEIVTLDEYGTAGTEYTIEPLLNQEIQGYDDGI